MLILDHITNICIYDGNRFYVFCLPNSSAITINSNQSCIRTWIMARFLSYSHSHHYHIAVSHCCEQHTHILRCVCRKHTCIIQFCTKSTHKLSHQINRFLCVMYVTQLWHGVLAHLRLTNSAVCLSCCCKWRICCMYNKSRNGRECEKGIVICRIYWMSMLNRFIST